MRQAQQNYYRQKGEGRPTKKDRREMDIFLDFPDENEPEDENWKNFFKENPEADV
jgi:ribosome-associated heat shock protein Hsp15